jgi:hypothetical protein
MRNDQSTAIHQAFLGIDWLLAHLLEQLMPGQLC